MKTQADLEVLQAIAIEEARRNFWAFRQYIDPDMITNWWQRDLAGHLQQFADDLMAGKRPKMLVQAPPQVGKSMSIVDFIAWISGRHPNLRTIYASFSEHLGERANLNLQKKFDMERFRLAFPELSLSSPGAGNSGSAPALRNKQILQFIGKSGYFRNTTVGGAITGESLDLGVLDDPIKSREEANSKAVRDKVWAWFQDDFGTRFSRNSGLLMIMTRWNLDDVAGRLIEIDPTVRVLSYPAIAEENDGRSNADQQHRKPGDALFPELKPIEMLEQQRRTMDPGSWESLYQQRPTVQGGNLFKIDDFKLHRHGHARPYKRRVIFADTAMKTGTRNDWSVLQCWGLGTDGVIYLIDQVRGKFEAPELEKVAIGFWQKHRAAHRADIGYLTEFKVEDKVSGTGLIQQLSRPPHSIPVGPIKRFTDKVSRGNDAHPSIANGLVSLPGDAPFTRDLLAELMAFPAGKHDDQVDPLLDAVAELLLKTSSYDIDAWGEAPPHHFLPGAGLANLGPWGWR